MLNIVDALTRAPDAVAYGVVAVAVLAESILLVGAFVPTFTVMITAGALASVGALDPFVLVVVAAIAVILGDFLGHRAGRAIGARSSVTGLLARVPASVRLRGDEAIARHGAKAVFFGRFVPVVRTVTPHLAGARGIAYSAVAPFSAAAAIVWSTVEISVGYLAAASVPHLVRYGPAVLAGFAALVFLTVRLTSRRDKNYA